MFGSQKKVEAAVSAVKEEYRRNALKYFDTQVKNMYGSGALAWLRGGLEMAQETGILSAKDVAQIDSIGKANFEANQKARREEKAKAAKESK